MEVEARCAARPVVRHRLGKAGNGKKELGLMRGAITEGTCDCVTKAKTLAWIVESGKGIRAEAKVAARASA